MTATGKPMIQTLDVSKRFVKRLDIAGKIAQKFGSKVREEVVHAVDGVSIEVSHGEVVGLVGESGCGKSTLGRMIAGILPRTEGDILFNGQSIADMNDADTRNAALKIQMIFQDPFASLNPRMRVEDIISEAPVVHGIVNKKDKADYAAEVMLRVGLDPEYRKRYPHQFSGGQRQRIGIARALAVNPAQVINLFMDLRTDLDLTYLFISHDLSVVEHISDRVVIMYLGRVVEVAKTDDIFDSPNHPYTQALLGEVPRLDIRHRVYEPVSGEIPSPLDPPPGCHFHPRCPHATARCKAERPALREIAPGRLSACHLNDG